VLVTCVKNFPDDRGSILGILKGFLGLSTSIYSSMFAAMSALALGATAYVARPGGRASPDGSDGSSSHWGGSGGGQGARVATQAVLAVLAVAPAALNFLGSLFINQARRSSVQ
jgi:hypothetical protein